MVVNWAPSPLGPERKVSEDLGIHCALKKNPLVAGDPILEYTHQDFRLCYIVIALRSHSFLVIYGRGWALEKTFLCNEINPLKKSFWVCPPSIIRPRNHTQLQPLAFTACSNCTEY